MGGECLERRFVTVRGRSLALIQGLSAEDLQISAFEYASPIKWHLGHSTWFFETFILKEFCPEYRGFDPAFAELFNSYYESLGRPFTRAMRGSLSRPALQRVLQYRCAVEERVLRLLQTSWPASQRAAIEERLILGLAHEEQHQELMVTDILANFSVHPGCPAVWPLAGHVETSAGMELEGATTSKVEAASVGLYRESGDGSKSGSAAVVSDLLPRSAEASGGWLEFGGGMASIGAEVGAEVDGFPKTGVDSFYFDHEGPNHPRWIAPFCLARDLVSNAQVMQFIEAGAYQEPRLWLSDGRDWVRKHSVTAPRYWRKKEDGRWWQMTVHGELPLDPNAPACHLSGFEADAVATWLGARLPTEFEWECAARAHSRGPESGRWFDPSESRGANAPAIAIPRAKAQAGLRGLWGEVWEWTRSALLPYPGYRASETALGEYNGKFMNGQWVLRGGSCATPPGHMRASYRNFFYPHQRWQFSGLRLAKDVGTGGQ